MPNYLSLSNLSFSFEKKSEYIFNNLNYEFISGDIVGIHGYNGSGKTTLLNCLSGYYKPTKGKVTYNNLLPDKCRKDISFISNDMDLIEYLNLEDNIRFFLKFYGKSCSDDEISNYLGKYDLLINKNKYVFEASSGMIKKVQIIISLLINPKFLLADEPTNYIDSQSERIFFNNIFNLQKDFGTIFIFSSHDLEMLKKTCNHIIYL